MPTLPIHEESFKLLVDALINTQGTGLAVYHILLELVIRMAQIQPDPSVFIKSMYESVSAKIDQIPLETQKKRASDAERETLSTFFSVAERAVRRRAQGQGGRKPRPA
jgi:hypothetical protein